MNEQPLKNIIEAALLAAGQPLTIDQMLALFIEEEQPKREQIRATIKQLQEDYTERALELIEVSSGFRLQVKEGFSSWVSRLWTERPSRYSRALLETLALVAYRQPITRGEIEDIRGVSVSSSIVKTLLEREWVRVVGHRDVPGKPAMYGSTKKFLDYFNLKSLDDLPTLAELRDLESISKELGMEIPSLQTEGQQSDQVDENLVTSEEEGAEIDRATEVMADESTDESTDGLSTEPGRLTMIKSADDDEEKLESEDQYVTTGG